MSPFSAIYALLPSAAHALFGPLSSSTTINRANQLKDITAGGISLLSSPASSLSAPTVSVAAHAAPLSCTQSRRQAQASSYPLSPSVARSYFNTANIGDEAAIIPIHGYILEGCDCPGSVSPSTILRAIDSALASGLSVLLDIDSPGGAVDGVPELSAYIASAVSGGHTIEAFTRGTCCSAAYWIAAPCSRILATRGATIGNCGCYAAFPCFAGLNEQSGITVTLFSSGELKAAGHPDIPLTEKQAAFLASHVQAIANMFFADVRAARPDIDEEALTSGAYYLAATARSLGFIDELVTEVAERPTKRFA